jgi:hypothetical protein
MLYSLDDLLKELSSGKNPSNKKVRAIISRDLQKYFKASDEYDKYSINLIKAFNKAIKAGDKALDLTPIMGDETFVGPTPVVVKSRGAGKIADNDIRKFFADIAPEIFKNKDLGHFNISVLAFKLEAALQTGRYSGETLKAVKSLLKICRKIDKMEGGAKIPKGKVNETLLQIIDEMRGTAEWTKDVDFSGDLANLRIEYTAEDREANQLVKAQLAAALGRVFSRLQKGNLAYYEKVILGKGIDKLKSSPTIMDDVEDLYLNYFYDNVAGKKNFKAKKPKKTTSKAAHQPKAKKQKKRRKPPYPVPNISKSRTKKSNVDITRLLPVLNERLPDIVARNMGEPALVNRTGRFASSVRAVDMVQTPQGFPSIGYTYMKNPYQTFEQGYAQGSTDADPRKLIDKSIREIAVQFAIGRFYTRRV